MVQITDAIFEEISDVCKKYVFVCLSLKLSVDENNANKNKTVIVIYLRTLYLIGSFQFKFDCSKMKYLTIYHLYQVVFNFEYK